MFLILSEFILPSFFEFEFVVDRGSRVLIKYGVAARGFYMFFNFVNVLLVVEYDGGIAFVSTKAYELVSRFHQGLHSSTSFKSEVVKSLFLFGIVVCNDGGCLMNGRGFSSDREVFKYILDERGLLSGGVLFGSGDKLQS